MSHPYHYQSMAEFQYPPDPPPAEGISVKNGVNQEFSVSLSTDSRRCWGTIADILSDLSPTYGDQTSGVTCVK